MGKLIIHHVKNARKDYKCDVCGKEISRGDTYYWYTKVRDPYRYKRCADHYPTALEIETNPKERLRIQLKATIEDAACNAETKADLIAGLKEAVDISQSIRDELQTTLQNWDGHPVAYTERFVKYEDGLAAFTDYATELSIYVETAEADGSTDLLTLISGIPMVPEINLG